ncbi:NnrS family protein [Afifella aestuarii]|uniref:NnrS family protein n=1 Tax=Afifella aestuarii TaxID=1909496 RepID=UPI000FE41D1A|nr:NnrS family protein [Afifella aestuarii]
MCPITDRINATLIDRSVPRRERAEGVSNKDTRGRSLDVAPILSYGFRPFFFAGTLFAGLAIPFWLWMYFAGGSPMGPFDALSWHEHEMIFGYVGAIIAGFILTAVPNWTGRLPLSGKPLLGLVALWLLGRIASAFVAMPALAFALDLAFPVALAFAIVREVVAGKNWKNMPVAVILSVFALANALFHAETAGFISSGYAVRLALGLIALLIALIGGRVTPSFTRNWLVKNGDKNLPAPFGRIDKIALLATLAAIPAWVVFPYAPVTGILWLAAGLLLGLRLSRWRGHATVGEPIVLVLHLGYLWLAISLVLVGGSILAPTLITQSAAIHALTAGAIGTMTLAIMTRASLGHTGRAIHADRWTRALYGAVSLGAVLRIAATFAIGLYAALITLGGLVWSLAFLAFALRYAPILWGRRRHATP